MSITISDNRVYLQGKAILSMEKGGTIDTSKHYRVLVEGQQWLAVDPQTWQEIWAAWGEVVRKQLEE